MFRESLLESSQQLRKHKRWPMATAFAGEVIVAGLVIVIPLLTTGVIPVSAHIITCPLGSVHVARQTPTQRSSTSSAIQPSRTLISLENNNRRAIIGNSFPSEDSPGGDDPPNFPGEWNGVPNLPFGSDRPMPPTPATNSRRLKVSELTEAHLLVKVEPVYPRIAVLTHRQGDVKLHAFIARDGSIESLSVISGDPLLANAALEAVRQWRYRPYYLNGEPVEVETFVTVSFKGIRN